MKLIPLTKGQFAQVDDWNYDWLNQWKWQAWKNKQSKTFYATRSVRIKGKHSVIKMHRLIMNAKKGQQVEHKDRQGLNCLEENLRFSTQSQNMMNASSWGRSKYRGVSFMKSYYKGKITEYITARIKIGDKYKHLGNFSTEEDAARARDKEAKIYHGEFANLNFPNE